MGSDVEIVRNYRREHADRSIENVKIMRVPQSEKFSAGVKYRMHHTETSDYPQFRFDNSHGVHEVHIGDDQREIRFPGLRELYRRFAIIVEHRIPPHP